MKRTVSIILAVAMMTTFAGSCTGCSLSKPKVDGEYIAELDIAPLANAAFESMLGDAGFDIDADDFKGEIIIPYILELDDGEYTITIDYDEYIDNYKDYVKDNLIPVFKDQIIDEIEAYGMTEQEFLDLYGYASIDTYCEDALMASIDEYAEMIEREEYDGDYKVRSGLGKAYVELDNGSVLYIEKGDLVAYMDKDLIKDIDKADDIDDLRDVFEDHDADESFVDACDLCENFGITIDDYKDWLEETGLADDGLVYEAQ